MAVLAPARDAFLQHTHATELPRLDLFVRLREPAEHHVYLRHLSVADFAAVFEAEMRPLTALVYRMPGSLLNPNYWEPLTREAEHAVREKMAGLITRQDGERTLLWRADSIAPGRWLRDGLNVPVELLHGYLFRMSGEGLLSLGAAWTGGRERFEWMAFSSVPEGDAGRSAALNAHNDVTAFRLSQPEQRIAYASVEDASTRLLFADRGMARKAAGAAVRGFALNCFQRPLPRINDRVCDQILRVCDGVGWTASPDRDFVDKGRAFEIACHLGRTEWGVHLHPGHPPLLGNEKHLVYYDRTSGIWAVAT
jgi:hypothetical protein